ncbi:hypothetical protein FS837_007893, partial [Tulasnella sp. UAMH 9824]
MQEAITTWHKIESTHNAALPSQREHALRFQVPPTTFCRILNGGKSISDFNTQKRLLSPAEESVLLDFMKDQA